MFLDEAKIYVKGGDGGAGAVAFRREKYVPRGGPAGGDGGKGGDVVFVVNPRLNTLSKFQRQVHFRAANGQPGGNFNRFGAAGQDLEIEVPPGTIVRDAESGELLADLTQEGQRFVVARGGRGGRGNARFKSSTNQAPRMAEKGEPGDERWVTLELKLLADVGLVGVPNAGKSTLISVISAARPKIAPYPFTTLEPSLGVATVGDREIVFADIPGLVEGAHAGVGLGQSFLRRGVGTGALRPSDLPEHVSARPASGRRGRTPDRRLHTDHHRSGPVCPHSGRDPAARRAEQDGPARRSGPLAGGGACALSAWLPGDGDLRCDASGRAGIA